MRIRQIAAAVCAGVAIYGVSVTASAGAGAPQAIVLPDKAADVTMVGCFLRVTIDKHDMYVLARPTLGPGTSVPEATCTSTGNEQMVELRNVRSHPEKTYLDPSVLGRWIEVTGRLEKIENARELRELNVKSYALVPVVTPQPPAEAPAYQPPPPPPVPPPPVISAPAPEPAPIVATPAPSELPHTGSSLPLIAIIGSLAFTSGVALLLVRRRTFGRG